MMTTLANRESTTPLQQVFDVALGLLADPEAWIQEDGAIDKTSASCEVDDPDACAWCLRGAIDYAAILVANANGWHVVDRDFLALRALRVVGGFTDDGPMTFNDDPHTMHPDVIRVLKKCRDAA